MKATRPEASVGDVETQHFKDPYGGVAESITQEAQFPDMLGERNKGVSMSINERDVGLYLNISATG
jgi:hypothetical protein